MYGWRRFLLRLFGAQIGKNVLVRPTARFTYPWKIIIGDHSWIGDDAVLYSLGDIVIGSNVVISQRSYVCTGTHDWNVPSFDIVAEKIVIHNEAWVATDVFIGPGVTIGKGTVVGARSSVLGELPSMVIAVGTPAKPIRARTTAEDMRPCAS